MAHRTCIFSLLVAFVVVIHSFAFAADRSHLSSDPRVKAARAMVKSGRFIEALRILRPLAPDHPDRTDVRFLIGLAAMEASARAATEAEKNALLDEAVAALHAILVERPGLVRVRLELARAFFLREKDDLSRAHFERVLAGRPHPVVAANVRGFLRKIRARRRWSGWFGLAIAPDTNIGAASASDVIYIQGLPFELSEGSRVSSGVGVAFWGGAEYQHPIGERTRLRLGALFSRREYKGSEFDQMWTEARLGPRFFVGERSEFSLLATVGMRRVAGAPYSREFGGRMEWRSRLLPRLSLSGQTSWRRRKHRRLKHLNGPLWDVSLRAAWLVTPAARLNLGVGFSRERPDSTFHRNSVRSAEADVSYALPWGFTLGVGGEVRRRDYEVSWFPFVRDGSSREDRERILRASVFHRAFTIGGFSPQLVVVEEERESNAQLYDYKRRRLELRFVRQF